MARVKIHTVYSGMISPVLFFICFSLVMGTPVLAQESVPEIPRHDFTDAPSFNVVRVLNGNTIIVLLHGEETEVRLIGVDAGGVDIPDERTQNQVMLTTYFLQKLLNGESVYLMRDTSSTESDESGRMLAYVYRAPDGLFVNLELIRQGYARVLTKYPFTYFEIFTFYENKALVSGKGLPSAQKPVPQRIVITDEDLKEDGFTQPANEGKPSKRTEATGAPELNVLVSCIDYSFQIYNNNNYPWTNVRIEVHGENTKGGYVYKFDHLGTGRLIDIPGVDFENKDGKRFDLRMIKPTDLIITCDTPWGKGYFETQW